MTRVGKGGGAGGPAKGVAPAHFFPLEGTGTSEREQEIHRYRTKSGTRCPRDYHRQSALV